MIILEKYILYICHCWFLLIFYPKITLFGSYENDKWHFVKEMLTFSLVRYLSEMNIKAILSGTQSVVQGQAVSASPGSLLKCRSLSPTPHLLNQNHLNNPFIIWMHIKVWKHYVSAICFGHTWITDRRFNLFRCLPTEP